MYVVLDIAFSLIPEMNQNAFSPHIRKGWEEGDDGGEGDDGDVAAAVHTWVKSLALK